MSFQLFFPIFGILNQTPTNNIENKMDLKYEFDYACRAKEGDKKSGYKLSNGKCYDRYMSNDAWKKFLEGMEKKDEIHYRQYKNGNGNELDAGRYPPKMACFGSSSRFIYTHLRDRQDIIFEKKLDTKIGGTANLDAYLCKNDKDIFIEAKSREIYGSNKNDIKKVYKDVYDDIKAKFPCFDYNDNGTAGKKEDNKFKCEFLYNGEKVVYLDIKQLICHFLAISANYLKPENETAKDKICFIYLIYNPKELKNKRLNDRYKKAINEINLYYTEMATALCSLDNARISANMSNRLSEAIVEAYKTTNGLPITFDLILENYIDRLPNPEKDDSVSSILKQLVRNKLFENEDKMNLIEDCFVVKMDAFPKDGPIAKAIVYFLISKLNIIYEELEKQAVSDDYVQIRHFTIIDEAHYMLDFDNRPLRNLIAVGRNKGLSIILATQNMASFQSKHFDFYANAQYPLIMKQQTITDAVIKDLFGVSGRELQEIRTEIAGLQKGELIIKDQMAFALDIGKKYKKIKVSHLI